MWIRLVIISLEAFIYDCFLNNNASNNQSAALERLFEERRQGKKLQMNNQDVGFTITEMLVTLVILSFVIAGLTRLFMSSNMLHSNNEETLRVQQEVRNTSKLLERYLKELGSDSMPIDEFEDRVYDMGDDESGRIHTVQLEYKNKNGDTVPSLNDARFVEYEVCGSVPEGTPYISESDPYCVESAVVPRNLHY